MCQIWGIPQNPPKYNHCYHIGLKVFVYREYYVLKLNIFSKGGGIYVILRKYRERERKFSFNELKQVNYVSAMQRLVHGLGN